MDRRKFLTSIGTTAAVSAFAESGYSLDAAHSRMKYSVAVPQASRETSAPAHKIKFAVIGINHGHIYDEVAVVQRGGGELVSFYAKEPDLIAAFQKRYPGIKLAKSEAEILEDPSIHLIVSSIIPVERAPLGIRVMQHGKDYLCDKPGITTLEQLAEVRKVQAETKRIYSILYSGRLESKAAVKATELVRAGAIGRVVQTINIASHQLNPATRADWFWDPARDGGILCDLGSHQADEFLFYTGSTSAEVVSSQVANVNHKEHPLFQDYGDTTFHGNGGMGYFRVDWFSPDGLGTWGDGRLFLLGTEGYIELRKYVDIAGPKGGDHLYIVDQKETRYIDCSNLTLPFGPQFISDIVNRTDTAQKQEAVFLAAELTLKAQKTAKVLTFDHDLPQPAS